MKLTTNIKYALDTYINDAMDGEPLDKFAIDTIKTCAQNVMWRASPRRVHVSVDTVTGDVCAEADMSAVNPNALETIEKGFDAEFHAALIRAFR